MGLIKFLASQLVAPGRAWTETIVEETGMTVYQQAMFLLAHSLVLLARIEGELIRERLSQMAVIQAVFSRQVMAVPEDEHRLRGILSEIEAELGAMDEEAFRYQTQETLEICGRSLPDQVRQEILIHLTMFHLVDRLSSQHQAAALGHIHQCFLGEFVEADARKILTAATRNLNTM